MVSTAWDGDGDGDRAECPHEGCGLSGGFGWWAETHPGVTATQSSVTLSSSGDGCERR